MAQRISIDLNADLGEGAGTERLAEDEKLLSLVSSANIVTWSAPKAWSTSIFTEMPL